MARLALLQVSHLPLFTVVFYLNSSANVLESGRRLLKHNVGQIIRVPPHIIFGEFTLISELVKSNLAQFKDNRNVC